MNDDSGDSDHVAPEPRYEVWLAERELLVAATAVRDAGETSERSTTRLTYAAAWMRFMVALCNLPVQDRPLEVERMIESLRMAHVMLSRGELGVGTEHHDTSRRLGGTDGNRQQ